MKYSDMLLQLLCNAAGFFLVVTVVGEYPRTLGSGTLMGAAVPASLQGPSLPFPLHGLYPCGIPGGGESKNWFFP